MPVPPPISNQQTGGNIGLFYVCYRLSRLGSLAVAGSGR
jgi:hypothetical protein